MSTRCWKRLRNEKGEKPRLVHRLDRDTSGVLVVARTRGAAEALAKSFRTRDTQKIYWAICRGVPSKPQGRISTWLVKEKTDDGDKMRVARHGEPDADHSETHYRVVDIAAQNLSWLELKPVTGRTHQLRVHTAHIGPSDHRRSQIFQRRELGVSRGHTETAASACAPHRHSAPRWRRAGCHGAAAAPYGADIQPAGPRRAHRRRVTEHPMRDILEELGEGNDPGAPGAEGDAHAAAAAVLQGRSAVEPSDNGFSVLLDGKPVRTPARKLLELPTADSRAGR